MVLFVGGGGYLRAMFDIERVSHYQCTNPTIIVRQHDQGASSPIKEKERKSQYANNFRQMITCNLLTSLRANFKHTLIKSKRQLTGSGIGTLLGRGCVKLKGKTSEKKTQICERISTSTLKGIYLELQLLAPCQWGSHPDSTHTQTDDKL